MNKINSFHNDYRFLSNFFPSVVEFEGYHYANVESAYQAAKSLDPKERYKIRYATSPGLAKSMGRSVTLREDWEQIKYTVMLELVRQKFTAHEELKTLLLATNDAYLEEGNRHGDRIWGTVNGIGTNWLGKILMQVREDLGGAKVSQQPKLEPEVEHPKLF